LSTFIGLEFKKDKRKKIKDMKTKYYANDCEQCYNIVEGRMKARLFVVIESLKIFYPNVLRNA
jgi:hypothetical protein